MTSNKHLPELVIHNAELVGGDGPATTLHTDRGCISISAAGLSLRHFDAAGLLVAPGFVDLQCNGAVGIDLTAEPERLWELAAALPRFGVTSFLPTLVSCDQPVVTRALASLRTPPAGFQGAQPLGLHLEGPLLNPVHRGAHPADLLRAPLPDLARTWTRAGGITMVTLAPELQGALEIVRQLHSHGVVVSAGHTDATATQMTAALDAGVTAATHLFNAMRALHHREAGIVGVALLDRRVTAGLIVDGEHVVPDVVALAWKLLGPARLALVTDSVSALAHQSGTLAGARIVRVGEAVRTTDGRLAGSVLSMDQAIRNLVDFTGCQPAEAIECATTTPARLISAERKGALRPGCDADLVVLTPDLRVVTVVARGRIVHGEGQWTS